jgi:hypothetical protein
MPPQQAYGLLDFVDYILDFGAHDLASRFVWMLPVT